MASDAVDDLGAVAFLSLIAMMLSLSRHLRRADLPKVCTTVATIRTARSLPSLVRQRVVRLESLNR